MFAARVAGHRRYKGLEQALVKRVSSDGEWKVRREALRALEVVGSRRCLEQIVGQLSIEEDESHARRYRRVLEKLLGERHGDDIDAWRKAVENVLYGGGKLPGEASAAR
jgi:HEAT repeat protein